MGDIKKIPDSLRLQDSPYFDEEEKLETRYWNGEVDYKTYIRESRALLRKKKKEKAT